MKKTVKIFVITLFVGCLLYVFGKLLSRDGFKYANTAEFLIEFAFFQLYTFTLSYVNTLFFNYIKKLEIKNYEVVKRIVYGIFGATFLSVLSIFVLRAFGLVAIYGQAFDSFIENESWRDYAFSLGVTISILSVFYLVYFYNHYQKNKVKEQKVIAGVASAKFDALKNQLDPHFLFNSLNVLTSLIEENPQSAQKFTIALSKVYRYVLEQKNKDLVTVDEELKFAKTYMSLLKMRFEDSIIFEILDAATNPESRVVPLSLQLLLENAVKHNTVTSLNPLHIKVHEDGDYLVVMNNLHLKQIVKKSSGVGLENIKQRYGLLSNKKVIINHRATDFVVALPMLTKQVSVMRTREVSEDRISDGYAKARKRMEELKEFYGSLVSYCVVIPILVFIYFKYSSGTIQWFWFPAIGWGLSLCFGAYRVFAENATLGVNWEQRKIEEYMQKEEENNHRN